MLNISRTYESDTPRALPESSQHTMSIINTLKKEEVLDGIKYLAMNERIVCKVRKSELQISPTLSSDEIPRHFRNTDADRF
ncbi:MAG: hypothetical protein CL912_28160 [Deltaproteobacteria bacterium]|nr:hypothetical protein [Deltaproteobacteria bacterium]